MILIPCNNKIIRPNTNLKAWFIKIPNTFINYTMMKNSPFQALKPRLNNLWLYYIILNLYLLHASNYI